MFEVFRELALLFTRFSPVLAVFLLGERESARRSRGARCARYLAMYLRGELASQFSSELLHLSDRGRVSVHTRARAARTGSGTGPCITLYSLHRGGRVGPSGVGAARAPHTRVTCAMKDKQSKKLCRASRGTLPLAELYGTTYTLEVKYPGETALDTRETV